MKTESEGSVQREPRTCPICGTKFFATADRELCPVCILNRALGAGPAATGDSGSASGLAAASAEEADVGSQVWRFENYEVMLDADGRPIELGRGAMGVTYKALDVDLRCPVTLKVISERYLGDETARLRFLREARAAAKVRHSNVASVLHLGRSGGNYFYAMEFVEGETLEHLIRRSGRVEVKLALEIVAQVAAGLAAVHEQNLVHRDIKPSNIMVRLKDDGTLRTKIIDLGLAKSLDEPGDQTAISTPGVFAGTPEFASPEQFAGVPVDIRSDLYSLGVTLWEMLIGRTPFRGSSVEVMYQHQHSPLPLEQLESVPQPIVVLLEVLLEKDPARRFQSPAELLEVMPLVRDAIHAGRRLMKTIRVFVSSTGDVQKERHLADRVMRSIAAEFNLPVSTSGWNFQRLAEGDDARKSEPEDEGALVLCPFFWEHRSLRSEADSQEQTPNTADFDLVVCILWSRLGTLPAPVLKMPDGSEATSGTEYEIGWALDHANKNRGVPRLQVYRNCSEPTPPLEPKEEREVFLRHWDSLQEFFTHWEKSSEESFSGRCNNYRDLQGFEELFRGHFRDFLRGPARPEDRPETFLQESTQVEIQPVPRAELFRYRTRAYLPR